MEKRGNRKDEMRKRMLELARQGVSEAYSKSDHSLVQAVNSYKEVENTKNLIYERLEEWYSIYFPEVRITSPEVYSNFILGVRKRSEVTEEMLKRIVGESGREIYQAIMRSGNTLELDEDEYKAISELANMELKLVALQKGIDGYVESASKRLMPNITYLIDYRIAAELLSKAGSLSRLATMPASTVQLLGAERALFKHLKFGGKPPKYGVLFKLPQLSNAAKKQRGRMARIYAAKISIAARADAFTKRFIADKLKESLERALANVSKSA